MIRLGTIEDLDEILIVFDKARKYMYENGNKTQWKDGHPKRSIIKQDIESNNLCVIIDDDKICGVFVLVIGKEPTYEKIEDGYWKYDLEYGTIQRLASDGTKKKIFDEVFEFSKSKINYLRADTHEDNKTVQHLLTKKGFVRSGIIYVSDKTKRIAYEYKE